MAPIGPVQGRSRGSQAEGAGGDWAPEQVIDSGADYVLALKGNLGALHQAVKDYFDEQISNDFAGVKARLHQTTETGQGVRKRGPTCS